MKKLLLLDVDCGVDDAVAIMIALASPSVEVLGITCCYGNSLLENTSRNTLRVLHVCNKLKIPVYSGASAAILGGPLLDEFYYGKDGLGDVPDPQAPGLDLLQKEHAVLAILRIANERPGQVSLVATGPLTNLALAVKMDPSLPKKLKNVFIMGGNIESRGNTTVCGEFNFESDPEAAYIVLNEYTCPVYIASWEFICSCPLSWEFYHEWINQNTEKAKFMKKIYAHSIAKCEHESHFITCDSYAMAAAIDENFVTEVTPVGVTVELRGSLTRGMMVVDWSDKLKKENKVFIMRKCDLMKLETLLMAALK
ncbi:inosine-uridine preferring nucleoside hydrolase-like [Sceloporus undulatus]|uniref:inosine-uridine preferring nucleoside hydrolase-like n=1 Tax=Sceloporus undulatus TaxID=8520 RepID=UPI001C4CCDD5|nr:inosine-uridine preferring nucleoside hydrolase-like [Sceloporus undulatus]XP_042315759.1 inosine-uridine preferring nucleoside hydrolase-like [Sceloporus undulatus]XP_042315760.1 inosine-uridine preferring nucleoside hydrolase-like [Sceloporus undulatus]XP_042315761.1 inosine-uridine preferring nucleoside hydrolase-like [Sceloporus undulatus]